ncbi:efflux RND transporter permease subunit [Pseudobacteriovorax antillogorgiicola]|uniref:Multidrug efflux pump subunit AcrB n=1 Tax=Pseudobacteriovorax antillogorgiicola TaxID=1513793 RepID=A0A1Y6BZG1_9BACT|nr:efflux RND transporter permease subunit [Pseudobacteriovorax antillogorgiicola]TCS52423.1 multidrug efflux pump subunit AcrB [Pseudobacteriovorax antillogorgiicola]SMF28793.1 Multidrug efflux pump subunit AcrB [Pseudobacteriovorax antillogorgiicola]
MKALIHFFLKNHKFTVIIMVMITMIGLRGILSLNSESYPTVDLGVAIVVTPYPGAAPEDVEADVTKPIEEEVRKVRGLKEVKSVSQIGLSRIVIKADIDNYDVATVMDDIESAVKSVSDLPPGIPAPKYVEVKSEEFPALEIGVVGDNQNRKRDRFADYLKEAVEDLKGVLKVELNGYREREFSIYLNQRKLNKFHVGADEVIQTLSARNLSIPAGDLVGDKEQLLVRLDGKTDNVDELLATPIRTNYSGKQVLLGDVAEVYDGQEDAVRLTSVNGQAATLLVVTKRGGADTIALVGHIEELLESVAVPEGLEVKVYFNEAEKVKNRTEVLISNAYIGLALVIVFMLIFLPGKVGIVASLSLPLALIATFGVMPILEMNLNVITICALVIALGMLVDNSVVIAENYVRLREDGLESHAAALKAAHQFWLPITCTAMTTIAGFLPMLVTKGVLGQFIRYIPIIVTLSLIGSLIESFFLLPMRLRAVDSKPAKKNKDSDWFKIMVKKFESFMDVMIRKRYLVAIGFSFVLFGSGYLLFGVNKFILFPSEQTEIYTARFEMKKGTTLEASQKASERLSKQIKEALGDDVEYIVAVSGKSEQDISDPKSKEGDNVGILKIYVTQEASFSLYYTDALEKMRAIDTSYLDSVTYNTVINGPPVGAPVNLTLRSHNSEQLQALSYKLLEKVKKLDGVENPEINDTYGDDEVEVLLNHSKIQRLGLSVGQIGSTIKDLLDGRVISELNLKNKKFNIRLRLRDSDKSSIRNLENIKIMDRRGNLIRLSNLAQLKKKSGSLVIKRYDYQRSKTLTADIDAALTTSGEANKRAIAIFQELNQKYPEVSLAIGGEEESTRESMQSLAQALGLAILGIFGVLVFLFSSYLRPLIIMSTIPLGITGVSIAFLIHDKPVSFLAMIGIIGLAGIIVNSGIVLISFIDELRDESGERLHDVLVKASGLRLKAVMVTSLTTISGLLPTAYGWGGADLILMPMTLAMAWGLVTGTILTLIWVPCAYALLEDFTALFKRALR